jgi:hypothetical protein
MSKRLYADRRALDGGLASGWRYVKKGGKVKFGGAYYTNPKLCKIVGEYVFITNVDYWGQDVEIHRGAFGCSGWFCKAVIETRSN